MSLQNTIEEKLNQAFSPDYLLVENESYMHNVPEGSESHFKVQIVSAEFDGQILLKRHRLVNSILKDELAGLIHALSMHTYTKDEWEKRNGQVPTSPPCQGGGK